MKIVVEYKEWYDFDILIWNLYKMGALYWCKIQSQVFQITALFLTQYYVIFKKKKQITALVRFILLILFVKPTEYGENQMSTTRRKNIVNTGNTVFKIQEFDLADCIRNILHPLSKFATILELRIKYWSGLFWEITLFRKR